MTVYGDDYGLTPIPRRSYTRFRVVMHRLTGSRRARTPGQCRRAAGPFPDAELTRPDDVVFRFILTLGILLTLVPAMDPADACAQTARVRPEQAMFRQTADGRRLAGIMQGANLSVIGRQRDWVEVALEGWIWSRSVQPTDRDSFDLVVTATGGENLRNEPGGRIAARLLQGFLLHEVESRGQWTRVRRTGWMQESVLNLSGPETPAATAAGGGTADPSGERPGPIVAEGRSLTAGASSVHLRAAPDGDSVAVVEPGVSVTVVERRNRWARVQVEGWVLTSELTSPGLDSVVVDVSAAALRANPEQDHGNRVRWQLQFISLERAEAVRTDFYEGEPFILARAPDPAEGFVYLAVPSELVADVETLLPLETIEVLAQVRTGRSALMGVPVLDLLAIY